MGIRRGWAAVALALVLPGAPAAPVQAEPGGIPESRVSVSVATLWADPSSPRTVDAPAVAAPARLGRWLADMSLAERRGLGGRVESQALLGQPVRVLERRGEWSRVLLVDQPSPKDPGGYPGWIPTAQLTESPATPSDQDAVVVRRRTWLHADPSLGSRTVRVSYNTRLPVVEQRPDVVGLAGPDGDVLWARSRHVVVVGAGQPARGATRRRLAREARRFLGLPYLWGGTSGFGFDCSGLTHTLYAHIGITIPRDAGPQFGSGVPVATVAELRRGDLVFFRTTSGALHHVGIYVGRGRMIHSPRTGQDVQYGSLLSGIWAREFAGGRRLL